MDALSVPAECTPKERGGIQAPRSSPILQSIGSPSAKGDGEGGERVCLCVLAGTKTSGLWQK